MTWQSWVSLLPPEQLYTFEKKEWTSIAAITAEPEVPAGMLRPGSLIRVTACGRWVSAAEAKYTFTLCWGTTGTKLLESEAIAPVSASSGTWRWESLTQIRETGTTGTATTTHAFSSGVLYGVHIKSSITVSCHTILMPESGTEANNGVTETAVETNVGKKLFLAGTCETSAAGNKILTHLYAPEILS